jgi:hypothetical protein
MNMTYSFSGVPELLLLKQNTTTETICNDGGGGLQLYKAAKSKTKLKSNESVTQRIAPEETVSIMIITLIIIF